MEGASAIGNDYNSSEPTYEQLLKQELAALRVLKFGFMLNNIDICMMSFLQV